MANDHFKNKASTYDKAQRRLDNVDNIAHAILNHIQLIPTMHLLDFGSGTGLLLERLAPFVNKITAIDTSPSMNKQLEKKRCTLQCALEILPININNNKWKNYHNNYFDGIISSMTLHHIKDIQPLFDTFYTTLKPNGFIALADLFTEDGNFHTEKSGIYHYGFDPIEIMTLAARSGFINIDIQGISHVKKPQGNYPVFLLTATKP